jgi:hypothetical protein
MERAMVADWSKSLFRVKIQRPHQKKIGFTNLNKHFYVVEIVTNPPELTYPFSKNQSRGQIHMIIASAVAIKLFY